MASIQKIEISHRTIVFTVIFLIGLWLIVQIRDIILLLFVSFILMSALHPVVEWLERFYLPRVAAIILLYFIGFVAFAIATSTIIPPLITQSVRLANQLPSFIASLLFFLDLRGINLETFTSQLGPLTQNIFRLTIGIFNNLFAVLTTLVFTFYFLLERKNLAGYLETLVGSQAGVSAIKTIYKIENRLGAWVRGELLLMSIVGILTYLGLLILELEFALPLALIAGLLEIVPVMGPIVSAIPAIIVALATAPSPILALAVAGLYFIVQQLENNVIVPIVMRQAVGLSPVVTLLALLIGGKLGGVGGAILAVPIVVTLQVILSEKLAVKEIKENK